MYRLGSHFAVCLEDGDQHIIQIYDGKIKLKGSYTISVINTRDIYYIFGDVDNICLLKRKELIFLSKNRWERSDTSGICNKLIKFKNKKTYRFDLNDKVYKPYNMPEFDHPFTYTDDLEFFMVEKGIGDINIYDKDLNLKLNVKRLPKNIYQYKNKLILIYNDLICIGSCKFISSYIFHAIIIDDNLICLHFTNSSYQFSIINLDLKFGIQNAFHDVVFRF